MSPAAWQSGVPGPSREVGPGLVGTTSTTTRPAGAAGGGGGGEGVGESDALGAVAGTADAGVAATAVVGAAALGGGGNAVGGGDAVGGGAAMGGRDSDAEGGGGDAEGGGGDAEGGGGDAESGGGDAEGGGGDAEGGGGKADGGGNEGVDKDGDDDGTAAPPLDDSGASLQIRHVRMQDEPIQPTVSHFSNGMVTPMVAQSIGTFAVPPVSTHWARAVATHAETSSSL